MATVQFYHLTTSPLERALPKLLEKAVGSGFRVALVTGSPEQAERLDQLLWTYDPGSFLAHGSSKSDAPEHQPIWITTAIEAPNNANLLCITNGVTADDMAGFDRVLDMFDGRDTKSVEAARARWAQYKAAGHELSYFQQSDSGNWQKAA